MKFLCQLNWQTSECEYEHHYKQKHSEVKLMSVDEMNDFVKKHSKPKIKILKEINEELCAQTSNIGKTLEADNSEGQVNLIQFIRKIREHSIRGNSLDVQYGLDKLLTMINKPVETK